MANKKRWYLGRTKLENYGEVRNVYLEDFTWDCGWYWGGGYIHVGKSAFCHFDGCFLDVPDIRGHCLGNFVTPWSNKAGTIVKNGCSIWAPIELFLTDVPSHISRKWWRIKDLYKQFYILRQAAEVFQYGGHCSSEGRLPAEIDLERAKSLNTHLETVIISAIREIMATP
jgi:hypothetical protein